MSITNCITISYKEGIIEGLYALSNTYMVALYTSSAVLGPNTSIYTTANECTGGNYPAGGIVMPSAAVIADLTTVILTFANPTFINLTLSDVRGCLIYNASHGNATVAAFDFGQSISLFSSDFTLIVPPATASTGLIRFN